MMEKYDPAAYRHGRETAGAPSLVALALTKPKKPLSSSSELPRSPHCNTENHGNPGGQPGCGVKAPWCGQQRWWSSWVYTAGQHIKTHCLRLRDRETFLLWKAKEHGIDLPREREGKQPCIAELCGHSLWHRWRLCVTCQRGGRRRGKKIFPAWTSRATSEFLTSNHVLTSKILPSLFS